jgi:hypothetical protein
MIDGALCYLPITPKLSSHYEFVYLSTSNAVARRFISSASGRPSSGTSIGVLVNSLQLTRIGCYIITSTYECITFGL